MTLETIVVFVPADGATPFEFPNEGVFGEVARNKRYPFAVAPEDGNVAPVQLKSILLAEDAVAEKPDA